MFTFAVYAEFLVAAAGSFAGSIPTFHTCSGVFARSRAVTIFLAVETAQKIRDIRVHKDPHINDRGVLRRLTRSKRQYHRVGATFAVSISYVDNHGSGLSQFIHDLLDAAAGNVPGADHSYAGIQ